MRRSQTTVFSGLAKRGIAVASSQVGALCPQERIKVEVPVYDLGFMTRFGSRHPCIAGSRPQSGAQCKQFLEEAGSWYGFGQGRSPFLRLFFSVLFFAGILRL